MSARSKIEYLTANGPTLTNTWYLASQGRPDAPVLGILHGLGGAGEDFVPLLDMVGALGWGAIAPEYPGHGGSQSTGRPATLDELTRIAREAFQAIESKRLVVLGHSLGGIVALRAFALGLRAAAFINVEGNLTGGDCGYVSRRCAGASIEDLRETLLPEIVAQFAASDLPGDRALARRLSDGAVDLAHFHALCAQIVAASESGELLTQFNELSMPRLYVYGEHSDQPDHLGRLSRAIDIVKIKGGGHFAFADNPTEFMRTLQAFVSRELGAQ